MKQFLALLFAVSLTLSGCVTQPEPTVFKNSRDYKKSKDAIWEDLVAYFASNNIQIKTIEKASGIISAEPSNYDVSFADCGKEGLANTPRQTAVLNAFVRATSSGSNVTVNTKFSEIRSYDQSTWSVDCLSRGVLETQILNALN